MQPFHRMLVVDLLDEELAVQALPHQAPLHVGEGDDDGVDLAALHQLAQLCKRQHADDPMPSVPPPTVERLDRTRLG